MTTRPRVGAAALAPEVDAWGGVERSGAGRVAVPVVSLVTAAFVATVVATLAVPGVPGAGVVLRLAHLSDDDARAVLATLWGQR